VRLFVAVRPPDRLTAALARLARPERPGVRWTGRHEWHVTLRFLGALDDPAPVAAALDAAPLAACQAVLGPRVATLGRQVVCVPVAGLDGLAAAVEAATGAFGRPPEDRPFRGHLTLARVRRGSAARLAGEAFADRFPVTDVRLVRSRTFSDGPRYEDVHVRPLGPSSAL
jgi:2'-5' RNA ligase